MASGRVDMKIVLLGKEYGGKTSLVERYLHDRFTGDMPYQSTIGAAFGAKRIEVLDRSITLGIWDTAGSERYEAMSRIYYRGAKAAIVCYDLSDRTSFERVRFWVNELNNNEEKCRIYLCGTKKDITDEDKEKRCIDYHMTTDYAEEIKAEVFETSSKTGENIRELFLKIGEDYVNDPSNQLPSAPIPKKNVNLFKRMQNRQNKRNIKREDEDAFELQDSGKKFICCG